MTDQHVLQHCRPISGTTEHSSTASKNARQLHYTAKGRFSWVMNREVIIAGLITACLFLICREIKHSGFFLATWNPQPQLNPTSLPSLT